MVENSVNVSNKNEYFWMGHIVLNLFYFFFYDHSNNRLEIAARM